VNKAIRDSVEALKRKNPLAKQAFEAMRAAGKSRSDADAELGRALLGCMWEVSQGYVGRFDEVFRELCEGKTTETLFPDAIYERSRGNA